MAQQLKLTLSPKPVLAMLAMDFIVRTLLFAWYMFYNVNTFVFILVHVILFIFEAGFQSHRDDKYKDWALASLKPTYKQSFVIDVSADVSEGLTWTYLLIGVSVSFLFFKKLIVPEHWYGYVWVAFLALLSSLIFVVVQFCNILPSKGDLPVYRVTLVDEVVDSTGKKSTTTIDQTKDYASLFQVEDDLVLLSPSDENDSKIAKLESQLKSINTRVDAYMLESVLIGALTFSGFLTIISSSLVPNKDEHLRFVFSRINMIGSGLYHRHWHMLNTCLTELCSPSNLFLLILFESLICSVFFILVLALRLRFSDLSLKLDYLIRIMNIFNAKEEELVHLTYSSPATEVINDRLARLEKKIGIALIDADKLYREIQPITSLMGVYRNMGIFMFYIILATSAVYFSSALAVVIVSIALLTVVFRMVETRMRFRKIYNLLRRH